MSVDAGFGGQSFNEVALDKLRQVRQMAPNVLLEIDGGVNADTIARCAEAGAQLFVVGSAIFRQPDYGQAIQQLASLAALRGNK
jgi:ribulose-phosphate 3-epimerase